MSPAGRAGDADADTVVGWTPPRRSSRGRWARKSQSCWRCDQNAGPARERPDRYLRSSVPLKWHGLRLQNQITIQLGLQSSLVPAPPKMIECALCRQFGRGRTHNSVSLAMPRRRCGRYNNAGRSQFYSIRRIVRLNRERCLFLYTHRRSTLLRSLDRANVADQIIPKAILAISRSAHRLLPSPICSTNGAWMRRAAGM